MDRGLRDIYIPQVKHHFHYDDIHLAQFTVPNFI
jgi:hypothetical protein